MNINKELYKAEFNAREYNQSHLAYKKELAFFNSIKTGNIAEMQTLFEPLDNKELGKLSNDTLRNLKYHLIITVALITRYCIDGGMELENAFNLSDIYIQSIDKCNDASEIHMLHKELVNDYIQRMQLIYKTTLYPKPVLDCIDFINNNLHAKITLSQLAKHTKLSQSHLSKMFHKETGVTVSEYVMKKRVEAAEKLLRYSEYSCIEISEYLCFCSESHFISNFKKRTGYTPNKYRKVFSGK